MPKGKSLVLDGMIVEILVHNWQIIKDDMLQDVLHFFRNRRMLALLNHTFLVLIPKNLALATLKEYKPISCLGVAYNVISRILSNRLMSVLPN